MERQKVVQETLGIAAVCVGAVILLHLVLPETHYQQMLLVLCVGIVLVTVASKLLPVVRTLGNRRFHQQTAWSPFSRKQPLPTNVSEPIRPQGQGVSMSEMNRYFAWIEKKLQELVIREGLQCGLVRMKRGPLVITLQLRLINPTQKDLQKLMKLGPALAQLLQVETVRIADSAQGILVEVPSPKPLTPSGALLARHTRGFEVPVGVDASARPLLVCLEDHGALYWVGPSRRGKTQSMKSVLYSVIRENLGRIQFIIIASPAKVQKDWGVFGGVAGCLGIASTKEEIEMAATWLVEEMNRGASVAQGIHIILIVDDLPAILKAVPQINGALADVAGMGAGLGIHLLVGTQGAGSKNTSGGTEIENNVTARILYRPSTTRTGSQSAGTGGLALHHLSSAKGDALALIDGQTTRIATAWISDQDIALLPSGTSSYPWRKQSRQNQRPAPSGYERPEQAKTSWNTVEQGVEQPKTTQSGARTGQNNPEQPRTTAMPGSFQRFDGHANGYVAQRPTEQVLEQSPEQAAEQVIDQDTQEFVSYIAQLSIEELKEENLGLDATRFPGADDEQLIRLAFRLCNSIRKTCFMAYGHYNGKVRDYIKTVIDGVSSHEPPQRERGSIPDTIDLNTPQGRALLERLQGNGLINWPDVDDLLSSER
jgi:hypothetical protein